MPVLPPWIGITLFVAVCAAAMWKGRWEERLTGAAFLTGWVLTLLLRDRSWAGTQWGAFAVDAAFLLLVVGVALRSRRYWPMVAAGFQLLAVVTHAARILDRHLGMWAYITAGVIWTWLVMAALAVGAYNRWRERQMAASGEAKAEPGATRR
jgi:hypothetical protein